MTEDDDITNVLRELADDGRRSASREKPAYKMAVVDPQVLENAADEIERLRDWQHQAEEVLERWDAVYEMVPHRTEMLGAYQSDVVADEIERLRALIIEWRDSWIPVDPDSTCWDRYWKATTELLKAVGR